MDWRETERDKREAERDHLAREVDQKAYKANRENRVTLLQDVRTQRASFDDRGENDDVFPDAYIKYLSGLSTGTSLSDDGKIIEKSRELYKEYEPKQGTGHYTGCWADRLATIDYSGRRIHQTKEKIDLFISENWFKEKDKNSIIFKKYVNMVKKDIERKRLEKEEKLKQERLKQERLKQEKTCFFHQDVIATHFCKTCRDYSYFCTQCDKDAMNIEKHVITYEKKLSKISKNVSK
jgi:hypothetical protein